MMKRSVFIGIFVLGILLISFSSAINSDMRDFYWQGETAIVAIQGNIQSPILKEDIELKRENIRTPFEYDTKKIGGIYYIWAIMPKIEGNYTLIVKNISTTVLGENKKVDYEKNFEVIGNITDYSVNPGFIWTDQDFEIRVNSYIDENIDVFVSFPQERNISLVPGENVIKFPIDSVYGRQQFSINFGKYIIPVYIIGKEIPAEIKYQRVDFEPREIRAVSYYRDKVSYPLRIINREAVKRTYNLDYDKNLFYVGADNYTVNPGEYVEFNITLRELRNSNVEDYITVRNGNEVFDIPVYIKLVTNESELNNGTNESVVVGKGYYCSELKGKFCIPGEVCQGTLNKSRDGDCCVGQCVAPKSSIGSSWIGWLIGVIVILIVAYAFFKYFKAGPERNPLKRRVDKIELEEKKKFETTPEKKKSIFGKFGRK